MNNKILIIFISVFISLLAIGGAFTIMSGKEFGEHFVALFALNFPLCLLLGGIDYFMVGWINRKISSQNKLIAIILNILTTSIACFTIIALFNLWLDETPIVLIMRNALCSLPWNLIIVMVILAMYYSRQQDIEAKEKAEYHLKMLKQQLHPHFLFNSLNTLASLAYTNPQLTNVFAKNLSLVYRYLLDIQNLTSVTIDREITFVDRYLQLEKIRFGECIHINIDSEKMRTGSKVIPVSIQLLVENAIKHNVCSISSPLWIDIIITESYVEVSNNINLRKSVSSTGLGLKNLKQQYLLKNKNINCFNDSKRFTVRLPFIE